MFSTKSLLAAVAASVLIGTVNAQAVNYTGTANLGFYQSTACGCPPFNGPYAVAIPSNLVGDAVCCEDSVTFIVAGGPEHGGSTTTAIFSGIYDGGAGTENVALSPLPFAALAGFPEDTSVADVTWFFN
ncbi:hypothetical protein MVEN_00498300 [Mycena venus]|uniref:Uncharacterized protein n=1 Tax=Mycena venus TaxID=2733690 RepID=A0A8H6YWR1_9AGAR|nr:hypothetical protein MVEN_00498300 [Mycena venus]KAJ7813428.1 hypothetical protein B0H14DRAFT_2605048 [Mycena olivaceomarginata]